MRLPPVALAVLGLAACDGGGDPVQQALRDASAARQAAAVEDGQVSGPAVAPSPSDRTAFAADMIVRNEAAIAAARTALRESDDAEVRRMARAVIDSRTREIAAFRTASTPSG